MVRFRVETIPLGKELEVEEEKSFLNSVVEYFRSTGADIIIPATTNTIFRTYPDGAMSVPYSSYIIDLNREEETLWNGLSSTYRRNIRKAIKMGVQIRTGPEHLETAYRLVRDTFKRSALPFMSFDAFKRYVLSLGENVKILVAEYEGIAHSCTVYPFSEHCAYAVYGGSIRDAVSGGMKLVQWEAIKLFREMGVKRFDLVGGRINPGKGSKAEGIVGFKQHFGAELIRGYMWKYPIRPVRSLGYSLGVRFFRGGDIVDYERHKMSGVGGAGPEASGASSRD
jgi:lipid II:glycine glycyltransferase (peptidoglycan interpeptide bridge formation enzyme)